MKSVWTIHSCSYRSRLLRERLWAVLNEDFTYKNEAICSRFHIGWMFRWLFSSVEKATYQMNDSFTQKYQLSYILSQDSSSDKLRNVLICVKHNLYWAMNNFTFTNLTSDASALSKRNHIRRASLVLDVLPLRWSWHLATLIVLMWTFCLNRFRQEIKCADSSWVDLNTFPKPLWSKTCY